MNNLPPYKANRSKDKNLDFSKINENDKAYDWIFEELYKHQLPIDPVIEEYIIKEKLYDSKTSQDKLYLRSQTNEYFMIEKSRYEKIKLKLELSENLPSRTIEKKVKI